MERYYKFIGVVGDCSLFVDIVDDRSSSYLMIPLGDMGEFNVMIADRKDRRKGYGYYSVLLVLMWCIVVSIFSLAGNRYLKLKDFFVKINKDNTPSIKMFEKIGFKFYHFNHHFDENEYRLVITNELSKRWILELGLPIKM